MNGFIVWRPHAPGYRLQPFDRERRDRTRRTWWRLFERACLWLNGFFVGYLVSRWVN